VASVDWQHQVLGGIGYGQWKEGLSFVDAMHGFLGAWDPNHRPTIYATADGGFTWASSTLPDPPGIFGIDVIVRAVALLRDEIPDLRLDVFGEGSALPRIQSLATELGVSDRVRFSGRFVPLDTLVRGIANAGVGVVALRRDIFRDLTHSNKMFDYITMRKPAIVSRTRSVAAYFDESWFWMFVPGDECDLAAISELHADPGLRERLVSRAARVNEPYRWPHQRPRYQEIVRTLLLGSARAPAGAAHVAGAEPRGEV
jgi:glycosyltransferase involved in cell wall biosynthesis